MDIFERGEIPSHLFAVKHLNLAQHCVVEKLPKPWFSLGETSKNEEDAVRTTLHRESMLTQIGTFEKSASQFDAIGAVVRDIGRPTAWSSNRLDKPKYRYVPFHRYEAPFSDFSAEPIVFIRPLNGDLIINPDLWLFLELIERKDAGHIWYDGEKHVDVIQILKDEHSERVLIRTEYLQKYLQSRQQELLVSEFRQILFATEPSALPGDFQQGALVLTNKRGDAKAIIESWGPKKDFGPTYYVRRMQYWSTIEPPIINEDDPFKEAADFDLATFVLPTSSGPVAPARFLDSQVLEHDFEGGSCDFMDRVFFSQEALVRYQTLPDHEVTDEGVVRHKHFWSFDRSVMRFGDDYVSIAIGDFAEGVPFHEWHHWHKYAVDRPGNAWFDTAEREKSIVGQVNRLVSELYSLNEAFEYFCQRYSPKESLKPLWSGENDNELIAELKWYFPTHGNDSEFRKRATQLSTLIMDSLDTKLMRLVLGQLKTIMPDENSLASRRLLQRVCLTAKLMNTFKSRKNLPMLLGMTFGKENYVENAELKAEVQAVDNEIQQVFAPLVGLYDLRTGIGLAHPQSTTKLSEACKLLKLPTKNWTRVHYLILLDKLVTCVSLATAVLWEGSQSDLND